MEDCIYYGRQQSQVLQRLFRLKIVSFWSIVFTVKSTVRLQRFFVYHLCNLTLLLPVNAIYSSRLPFFISSTECDRDRALQHNNAYRPFRMIGI
jgi:hypothetical protein